LTPFQKELQEIIAKRASTPHHFTGDPSNCSPDKRPISRLETPSPVSMEEEPKFVSQEANKALKKAYDSIRYQGNKAQKKMCPG
jgi:hypothetical protein